MPSRTVVRVAGPSHWPTKLYGTVGECVVPSESRCYGVRPPEGTLAWSEVLPTQEWSIPRRGPGVPPVRTVSGHQTNIMSKSGVKLIRRARLV